MDKIVKIWKMGLSLLLKLLKKYHEEYNWT